MEGINTDNGSFGNTTRANTAGLELESLLAEEERGDEVAGRELENLLADEGQVDKDASLRPSDPHAFFPVYKTIHL